MNKGMLIFLSGKMGAGKSTLSQQLAREHNAVLLSEDEWLSALYPDEIHTFEDYLNYSARLKPVLKQHVQHLLQSGLSVVMDFPANTPGQRNWFRSIFTECGAPHKLVYVKASDDTCLKQIAMRRQEQPERAEFDTEAVFRAVTGYFEAPVEGEGFVVEVVGRVV